MTQQDRYTYIAESHNAMCGQALLTADMVQELVTTLAFNTAAAKDLQDLITEERHELGLISD